MPAARIRLAVVAVLFAVGSAQAADLVTFVRLMLEHGAAAEANPLVRSAVVDLGLLPLVVAKVALVVLVVAAFSIVVRTRVGTGKVVAALGTAAGLIGAFSNVLAL